MKPVVLMILDGFGIAPPGPGNAITLANPITITSLQHTYPNTTLRASGEAVGLPSGEVGNTEVGHINIGAGRIVYQDLPRINMSIADGGFYKNQVFLDAVSHIKKTNGSLHLMGLTGEGAVHSSLDHLYALLFFAKEQGITKVYIHAITDGRDSPPKAAAETLRQLQEKLTELGIGTIVSITGRYYAMDRDQRWDRVQKAYSCLTKGEGLKATSVAEAIETAYKAGKTDEFIDPTIIQSSDADLHLIKEGDSVVFFNFRIDRPRELTKAFVLDNFTDDSVIETSFDPYEVKYHKSHIQKDEEAKATVFERGEKIKDLYFVTMTEYEKNLPVNVAFPPKIVGMPLGKVVAEHGLTQLRMSESEKERFVTYYFNGLNEGSFINEERIIIPSPKVPTYDQQPEMSALLLTDKLIEKIKSTKYHFILINFANPDMVGHTGNIEATIKAIKTIDACIQKILAVVREEEITLCITADHGNAEQKINPQTGQISTEHTSNPVPFIIVNNNLEGRMAAISPGILADVAPTVLGILGIEKPPEMSGRNLLDEIN